MGIPENFIGRSEALNLFYTCRENRKEKNVIYYYGDGGIGKTWILKKIFYEYQDDPQLKITEIIDFFDTQNHNIRGLQAAIKSRLQNPQVFQPYDEILKRLSILREVGEKASLSEIANVESQLNEQFIQSCQQVIKHQEIILLFDTFERVQNQHVGQWLLEEFLPHVLGLIVVIAGRPVPEPAPMSANIISYPLKGLNLEETKEYILRHASAIAEQDIQKIWNHTSGAPLFTELILDLPRQLQEQFIAEIKTVGEEKPIQDLKDLQRGLVRQFTQISKRNSQVTKKNQIIWAMAYLRRRFDLPMLKYIVENGSWFEPGDYDLIFEELTQSAYVKDYPEGQSHLLHDEVQRMVEKYILDEAIDPWEEMRDLLYDLIVHRYYPEIIQSATEQENIELARQLKTEQLGYILDKTHEMGLKQYEEYRSQIEQTYDYDFEELLWGEVSDHLTNFKEIAYQICRDRALWLRKQSLFYKAEGLVRQVVITFPEQPVETRELLGFLLLRLGRVAEANKVLNESRQLIKEDDFKAIASLESTLGQVARVAGRWDDALQHYAKSFGAATRVNDSSNLVSVYRHPKSGVSHSS